MRNLVEESEGSGRHPGRTDPVFCRIRTVWGDLPPENMVSLRISLERERGSNWPVSDRVLTGDRADLADRMVAADDAWQAARDAVHAAADPEKRGALVAEAIRTAVAWGDACEALPRGRATVCRPAVDALVGQRIAVLPKAAAVDPGPIHRCRSREADAAPVPNPDAWQPARGPGPRFILGVAFTCAMFGIPLYLFG